MSRCYKCVQKIDEETAIKELIKPTQRGKKIGTKDGESLDDEPKLLYRHPGC